LMARRLEAGCINTGLSQLQVVFNELKVKGKLTKSKGTGLRRILHAYINQNSVISVMFTLSPAFTNRTTTESTLKFAVQAGMVKVKPVKAKAQVNFKALVAEFQKHVKDQEELIEKLNDDIEKLNDKNADLELKVNKMTAKLEAVGTHKNVKFEVDDDEKSDVDKKRKALQKLGFKRQKSRMPDRLQSQLNVLNDEDEDEDHDGYINLCPIAQKASFATNVNEAKVDNEIKRIHQARKTMGVDTNMLNNTIRELNLDESDKKVEPLKPRSFTIDENGDEVYDDDIDDDPDNVPSFADIQERQITIKSTMAGQKNIFDEAQKNMEQKEDDEEEQDPDFLVFETMDTANMSKDELVDYCDQLESKLIEEKTLRYGLQKSQQVIIDHLMETNEALLQWFKIKKIL